ncbi:response regulator [Saccharibacillus sacchari]|uniref:response regulator n=1 Tax=Saccharibacillus sacchari TaxID=456493 RepID=UPI000563E955|nr:response regulator [Saccharibacillus sacchari]
MSEKSTIGEQRVIPAMIVDDEAATRAIIRRFGEWDRLGIRIAAEAEDGGEALKRMESEAIRLVITDMNMPGVDGVGLMKTLNERYPQVKVVVVSGYDDFAYLKQAIRYRANDYLLKPVDPAELNRTLEKCRDDLIELEQQQLAATALDDDTRRRLREVEPLIRAHYGELRMEDLHRVLEELVRGHMEKLQSGAADCASERRLSRELMQRLHELRQSFGQEEEPIREGRHSDGEPTLPEIPLVYQESLEQLIRRRKFRDRLDLNEVRAYVAEHFAEALSLDGLARCFFVSKEYLSRTFRQEFGQTLTDYIQQVRMEKARAWILEGVPIRRASEMCGYEDVGYFYRVFKKQYGIAPGELTKGSI